jgi:hypothetical protein
MIKSMIGNTTLRIPGIGLPQKNGQLLRLSVPPNQRVQFTMPHLGIRSHCTRLSRR